MKMKLSRNERAGITRNRLYRSAMQAIAEHGFEKATVARITAHAEVSIGTFYNYFESREELLRQVVLSQGRDLRRSISGIILDSDDFFHREEKSFRQYFEFLKENPHYIRLLNEAEIFLPDAYEALVSNILDGYRKALKAASARCEIRQLEELEIDGVALMLMGTRHYYGEHFPKSHMWEDKLLDNIVEVYIKFIQRGLRPA